MREQFSTEAGVNVQVSSTSLSGVTVLHPQQSEHKQMLPYRIRRFEGEGVKIIGCAPPGSSGVPKGVQLKCTHPPHIQQYSCSTRSPSIFDFLFMTPPPSLTAVLPETQPPSMLRYTDRRLCTTCVDEHYSTLPPVYFAVSSLTCTPIWITIYL